MVKKLKFLLIPLILSLGLGVAAGALTDVTPADSALNPLNQTLYVVDNSVPRVKVYSRSVTQGWNETPSENEALPASSKCYGLAVTPSGTKLYVGINQGTSSAIRRFNLDGTGNPTSSTDMTGPYFSMVSASSPAGMEVGGGNRLFVADKGVGRVLVFNTSSDSYVKAITEQLAAKSNLYDVAVTSTSAASYKLYVSRKVSAGEIYVYSYDAATDTATYIKKLSPGTYPTQLKVAGDKLYVAINGTSGDDIQVYSTADESLVGTVRSGVTGSYGWTSLDISGNYLYFKKARNSAETSNGLYRQRIADISGTVTATELTDVIKSDGVKISLDGVWAALSNSPNGSVELINIRDILPPPATVTDFDAQDDEDSQSTLTWTNPSDSDLAQVIVVREIDAWPVITASGVPTVGTIIYDVTSPAPGSPVTHVDTGLTNGTYYRYAVFSRDTDGNWNTTLDYVHPDVNADVAIPHTATDTTPPAAITDLIATPGSSGGEVDLTWTAPGDDDMTGTVSEYRLRYITSSTPLIDAFAGGFEDVRAVEHDTSAWGALVAGGSTENRTLSGLPYDAGTPTYIYVAIIAADERPNWSGISNIASTFVKDSIPEPVVTLIYPNRAPNASDTDIVIEGENFVSPADVQLKTTVPTALTSVAVINLNRIEATVPAGVDPGTYHITVTTPGGESAETPADEFTVMDGPEDPPTPSQVINFRVVPGDGQCILRWTNPSDMDMATITVRRAGPYAPPEDPANYPADQTAGYEVGPGVISGIIPTPGAAMEFTDSGLTNDQVYYYVVYIKDTSDNWSVLDYDTAGGQNAATGIPTVSIDAVLDLTVLMQGFYNGTDQVITGVSIEARDAIDTTVGTWYSDLDSNGNALIDLTGLASGNYYIVVRHDLPNTAPGPNHLAVMSEAPVSLTVGSTTLVNFSDTASPNYVASYNSDPGVSPDPMIDGPSGMKVMRGGDANGDGVVGIPDFAIFGAANGAVPSSPEWDERADFDGSGVIGIPDFAIFGQNNGMVSYVP